MTNGRKKRQEERAAQHREAFRQALQFHQSGQLEQAVANYNKAIALQPDYAEAHSNLGVALKEQGELEQAVARYQKAIALKPDYIDAHYNLGVCLKLLGRFADAIASYRKVLSLDPDHVAAHYNLGIALLLTGELEKGWQEYQWRWRRKGEGMPDFPQPLWRGEPLEGKSILLHCEQGLGDSIQFVRFVALAKERGAAVTLACPPELERIFQTASGIDRLITTLPGPPCDYHAPLLDLPHFFEAIPPNRTPYLQTDPERVKRYKERLADLEGFKVGLVWRGDPKHKNDANRSMAPEDFMPLLAVAGCAFVGLQKDATREELQTFVGKGNFTDLGGELDDFTDTTAILEQLDLLISVDTAAVHLAGALGRPAWVFLPFIPDWRWLLDRDNSPWYPTLRLFRQHAAQNWSAAVDGAARQLECRVTGKPDPLVSIIVPSYNREQFIGEGMECLLAQSCPDWEAIVVDDGATDGSAAVVEEYAARDSRIRLIRQENRGTCAARNVAIRAARAKWLMFQDDDDAYLPNAVSVLTGAMAEQPPGVKLAYADQIQLREEEERVVSRRMAPPMAKPYLFTQLMVGCPIQIGSVIVDRQAVIDVGMFDETIDVAEDFDLWTRLALKHDVVKFEGFTYRYRIHSGAQGHKKRGRMRYHYDKASFRLFTALSPEELFPEARNPEGLADALERIAARILENEFAALDTALYACRIAYRLAPSEARRKRVEALEETVREMMRERFDDGPRIQPTLPPEGRYWIGTPPRRQPVATGGQPQAPFAAAVVIPSVLGPHLAQAVRSVFTQNLDEPVQILIGIDKPLGDTGVLETLRWEAPPNRHVTILDPGYSTSTRHGGLHPAWDGGALRTVLSYLANSRYVAYLDDDNWWHPEHLTRLLDAIQGGEGREWAFSLRWFVDPESGRPLAMDHWESLGPSTGVFQQKFGGFVDPSCLMLDKSACEPVLPLWSQPLPGSTNAMDADRRVFAALRDRGSHGRSNRPTVFYRLDPNDGSHAFRMKSIRALRERSAAGKA